MDNPPDGMTTWTFAVLARRTSGYGLFLNEDELDDYFGEEGWTSFTLVPG